MIALTAQTLQQHRISWHNDQDTCARNAALVAKDVAATKERLICDAIRQKLGTLPELITLRNRLQIHCYFEAKPEPINYLVLDDDVIAVFTDPKTSIQGGMYSVSWHWKNLVDVAAN